MFVGLYKTTAVIFSLLLTSKVREEVAEDSRKTLMKK